MKYISFILSLFTLKILFLQSCTEKPSFSTTPEIEYAGIQHISFFRDGIVPARFSDSIYISIKFRDGDGDLGLNTDETAPPYADTTETGEINKYRSNFFWEVLRKENGEFVSFPLSENTPQRFPYLNEESTEGGPLEGILRFGFEVFPTEHEQVNPGRNAIRRFDTLKFRVNIADRALNESNIIETDEVVVNQNE